MNTNMSTIEIFPNELFREIFQYLSAHDLFNIFYSLNFRFYSLVQSEKNLRLTLDEDWDTNVVVIPSFSTFITSLVIKHDQFVDFLFFPSLKSLKLCMPSFEQCNAILPRLLPNLQYLFISNLYRSNPSQQLCQFLFSSSFPRLQICQIDRLCINNLPSTKSLSLNQLIVSPRTWRSNLFPQLFDQCPNLFHLRIQHFRAVSFHFVPDPVPMHPSIHHLFIHFDLFEDECYDQLKWILSTIPNLETLVIHIDENQMNTEFLFIVFFPMLNQLLPNLIRLRTRIFFDDLSTFNFNILQHLHRLFSSVQVQLKTPQNNHHYLLLVCHK